MSWRDVNRVAAALLVPSLVSSLYFYSEKGRVTEAFEAEVDVLSFRDNADIGRFLCSLVAQAEP